MQVEELSSDIYMYTLACVYFHLHETHMYAQTHTHICFHTHKSILKIKTGTWE